MVKMFTEHNFLKLNTSKCEIVLFGRGKAKTTPECDVDGSLLPVGNAGKCLGFWWKGDLMATESVKENISKARRAYFHWGSLGAFQGNLNPLSCKSILETCVMPVLLYGCENWILNAESKKMLESFQGELAKRILKWPKHFSNTAASISIAIGLQWIESRILERKLSYLQHVLVASEKTLSGSKVEACCDEISSLCVVKECQELESAFGLKATEKLLNREAIVNRRLKEDLRKKDHLLRSEKCKAKAPMIVKVETRVGWCKLWDRTLEFGVQQ